MRTLATKRLLVVWLVLSAITLIYLWIDRTADDDGATTASSVVTVTAIVLALAKVGLILAEFMELRSAPPLLRRLAVLAVVLMGIVLLGMYAIGTALA